MQQTYTHVNRRIHVQVVTSTEFCRHKSHT